MEEDSSIVINDSEDDSTPMDRDVDELRRHNDSINNTTLGKRNVTDSAENSPVAKKIKQESINSAGSRTKEGENINVIPTTSGNSQKKTKCLFVCRECKRATDSYDSVVSHSQKHFTNMQSYGVILMNCDNCSLIFEEECFNEHMKLHEKQFTKDSFITIEYDYSKLFTDDWLDILNTVPKESQILRDSIYKITRKVEMFIYENGSPEYTIYCCKFCHTIILPKNVLNHADACEADACKADECKRRRERGSREPEYKCVYCNIDCKTELERDLHAQTTHGKKSKNKNLLFRVVFFNGPVLNDSNSNFRANESASHTTIHKYYKCLYCFCCIPKYEDMCDHVCPNDVQTVRVCQECNIIYSNSLHQHIEKHKITDMTADDVVIIPFRPKDGRQIVRIYNCHKCHSKIPVHLKTSHKCLLSNDKMVKQYKCKTCEELFSTEHGLKMHIATGCKRNISEEETMNIFEPQITIRTRDEINSQTHSEGQNLLPTVPIKSEVNEDVAHEHQITSKSVDMQSEPNQSSFSQNHGKEPASDQSVNSGQKKEAFLHQNTLKRYQTESHSARNSKQNAQDTDHNPPLLASAQYGQTLKTQQEFKKYTFRIFKCALCEVYFIHRKDYYEHWRNHTPIAKKAICTACNLQFKVSTIEEHDNLHHKVDMNLDEVQVEEAINEGSDLHFITYCAADRVQSRSVTTTNNDLDRPIQSSSVENVKLERTNSCELIDTTTSVNDDSSSDTVEVVE